MNDDRPVSIYTLKNWKRELKTILSRADLTIDDFSRVNCTPDSVAVKNAETMRQYIFGLIGSVQTVIDEVENAPASPG